MLLVQCISKPYKKFYKELYKRSTAKKIVEKIDDFFGPSKSSIENPKVGPLEKVGPLGHVTQRWAPLNSVIFPPKMKFCCSNRVLK